MATLTDLETKVLARATVHCTDDYSSSVKEIAEDLKLPVPQVRGCVGSLVKKGKLQANDPEVRGGTTFHDLFVIQDGGILCWGEVN